MVESTGKIQSRLQVHIFSVDVTDVHGEVTESEEMAPQVARRAARHLLPATPPLCSRALNCCLRTSSQWWAWDAVPFDKMWVDDEHWLPTIIAGDDVIGDFTFADQMTIVHKDVRRLPAGGYKEAELL